MLVWLTLPFYDFCGFRSVAVNSVYKLQFFYIYLNITEAGCQRGTSAYECWLSIQLKWYNTGTQMQTKHKKKEDNN